MNPIFINGIGIISAAAKNSADLLNLAKENTFDIGSNSAAFVVKNFKGGDFS